MTGNCSRSSSSPLFLNSTFGNSSSDHSTSASETVVPSNGASTFAGIVMPPATSHSPNVKIGRIKKLLTCAYFAYPAAVRPIGRANQSCLLLRSFTLLSTG